MTLGDGKQRADVRTPPAPPGHFRVVGWLINEAGGLEAWVEDEFPDRVDAKASVDALMVAGAYAATAFNDRGRHVYVRSKKAPNHEVPASVTRLAGQQDPMRRIGTHRRK